MPLQRTLTDEQLRDLPLKIERGEQTIAELARTYGVSRKTIYAGLKRVRQAGAKVPVLRHRGRPEGLSPARQIWLRRLLQAHSWKPYWGAVRLRLWLEKRYGRKQLPPERTLHRWLKVAGRVLARSRRQKAGKGMLCLTMPKAANAIWTVDFKGDWCSEDGRRLRVLTVRDLYSRCVLSVNALQGPNEQEVHRVFARLFRRHGQPAAIRSDQGVPFCGTGPYGLTRLSIWWMRLGIEVQFVNRAKGIYNNAHEEMHRRLKREAATPPSLTYRSQLRRLYRWRTEYNQTAQSGLGRKSPQQLYKPAKKIQRQPMIPIYPQNWLTRKVRSNGAVKLHGSLRHIGRAFTELNVAFEPVYFGYKVYFMHLLLGAVDPKTPRSGLTPLRGEKGKGEGYAPSLKPSPAL